jgi:hypothetical protein
LTGLTLFFAIPFINIDVLNFIPVKQETVYRLVDQRTANIVTFISISLAVVGFLISNLAIKEPFTYQLLFKRTYFYPVIIFVLTIAGCFIVLSTLRDAINPAMYSRYAINGTYLLLLSIGLVGYLFWKLKLFISDTSVNNEYRREVKKLIVKDARRRALEKISNRIYEDYMNSLKIRKYSYADSIVRRLELKILSIEPVKHSKEYLISDVDLKTLKQYARVIEMYDPLGIGEEIHRKKNVLRFTENIDEVKLTSIRKAFKYQVTENAFDYKELLETRLKQAISDNKEQSVAEILDIYYDYYEIQREGINSGEIGRALLWELYRAIERNSLRVVVQFRIFIHRVLVLSINHNNIETFRSYISFPTWYYQKAYSQTINNSGYKRIYEACSEFAGMQLREITSYFLVFPSKKTNDIEEKKRLNRFIYLGFNAFSSLLYEVIKNKAWTQFRLILNELSQLYIDPYSSRSQLIHLNATREGGEDLSELKRKVEIEQKPALYYRHTNLGVLYWIYYLYSRNLLNVDSQEVAEAVQALESEISYSHYGDILDDLIFLRGVDVMNDYLGWGQWDYEDRLSGTAYSPPQPREWITFGFIVDFLRNDRFLYDESSTNQENIKYLCDDLIQELKNINGDSEKYLSLTKADSEEELNNKITKLQNQLVSIKRKRSATEEKKIAQTPLSSVRVEEFKQNLGRRWKENAFIHHLFIRSGNVIEQESTKNDLKDIGQLIFMGKGKRLFVDIDNGQDLMHNLDGWGGIVGQREDDEFYRILIEHNSRIKDGNSLVDVIEQGIKDISATMIIIGHSLVFDREFRQSNRFIEEGASVENNNHLIGKYDSIPVYRSQSKLLGNTVIICNFPSAFSMKHHRNPDWYEEVLNIDVRPISDAEAIKKLEEDPERWKKDRDGNILSEEEAITLIKTSVIVDIYVREDFEVVNPEKFVVYKIAKNTDLDNN